MSLTKPGDKPHLRGVVILATDTGVGKTFIGCALAQALNRSGYLVRVRKPVETGCQLVDGDLFPADAHQLWAAAGKVEPLDSVCPLRFSLPVAAPQAAANEGKSLRFARDVLPIIKNASQKTPNAAQEFWQIEGAGGALSPLTDDALNCELATATNLPVVLIAPDRLGTLSTLFAHIEALDRRSIPIAAIVLNQRPAHLDADNRSSLRSWLSKLLVQQNRKREQQLPALLSFTHNATAESIGTQLMTALFC